MIFVIKYKLLKILYVTSIKTVKILDRPAFKAKFTNFNYMYIITTCFKYRCKYNNL